MRLVNSPKLQLKHNTPSFQLYAYLETDTLTLTQVKQPCQQWKQYGVLESCPGNGFELHHMNNYLYLATLVTKVTAVSFVTKIINVHNVVMVSFNTTVTTVNTITIYFPVTLFSTLTDVPSVTSATTGTMHTTVISDFLVTVLNLVTMLQMFLRLPFTMVTKVTSVHCLMR